MDWSATNQPPSSVSRLEPIVGGYAVDGNTAKFREVEGAKEGFYGGVGNYSTTQQLAPDETISFSGHLIPPDHDFGFQLALDKTDVGFIHTGFDAWQKYYAADGGYDPAVFPSYFNLDNNLYVDNSHAWVEAGLDLPRWPQIVLGYEYRSQIGNESTLDWGYDNGENIYPSTQMLNQQTHSLKLDISKNFDDWLVEDHARVDFYTENNQGVEGVVAGGATPKPIYHHAGQIPPGAGHGYV